MPTVLEAMGQFLDWWIGLVIIVLLYYLFKFLFMFGGETEEDKEGRKQKFGSAKKQVKKWGLKSDTDPIKGFLVKAINAAERAAVRFRGGTLADAGKARDQVKILQTHARQIWRELRKLRDKKKGEERKALEQFAADAQIVIEGADHLLSESDLQVWVTHRQNIVNALNTLKGKCGEIIAKIENLTE